MKAGEGSARPCFLKDFGRTACPQAAVFSVSSFNFSNGWELTIDRVDCIIYAENAGLGERQPGTSGK